MVSYNIIYFYINKDFINNVDIGLKKDFNKLINYGYPNNNLILRPLGFLNLTNDLLKSKNKFVLVRNILKKFKKFIKYIILKTEKRDIKNYSKICNFYIYKYKDFNFETNILNKLLINNEKYLSNSIISYIGDIQEIIIMNVKNYNLIHIPKEILNKIDSYNI